MGAMLPAVGMYLGLMTCVLYLHVRCREDPSAVWLLHIIQHLLTPDDTPLECLLLFVFVCFFNFTETRLCQHLYWREL